MRLTQGAFSFLPDLTDAQISAQVEYCLERGWAVSLEYTDDPHPRNTYWEMFGAPMFDLRDAAGVMTELKRCREEHPNEYIKVNAFDASPDWEALRMSFIAHRPAEEPGFGIARTESAGRKIIYTTTSYAAKRPAGERYR